MNRKIICMMIITIIIFSGCTGKQTSPNQTVSKQTVTENTQEKGKILEIPGFSIKSKQTYAYPKNSLCTIKNIGTSECSSVLYTNNISDGFRFGGTDVLYFDDTGKRKININTKELDKTEGVKEYIDNIKTRTQTSSRYVIKFGDPSIGDYSMWMTTLDPIDPDVIEADILFLSKNSFVQVGVTDKKDIGLDEAIKIAKQLS